jgi:redox-sensitive bicupin YhaK (pirin superfamily)
MIQIRRSNERGHANHGWLDSYHSFSFADYYDPEHMGFRSLRVLNEDVIQPARGFGMHPHHNMEILTYVVSGTLEHRDSLGSGGKLRPGELQRMSAGKGIMHSEVNPSETEAVHLLQIWLLPDRQNIAPSYEQRPLPQAVNGSLCLIASSDGRNGTMRIQQDVDLYAAKLSAGTEAEHALKPGRYAWLQLVKGDADVNGESLSAGDAARIENETSLHITARSDIEFLLFDLN